MEGNMPGRQFGLQQHAVVRGPKQHRLPPQGDARLAMFEDLADHEVRLLDFVVASDLHRPLPLLAIGPEILRIAFGRQSDHAVGGLQDRLRAAVVLLQPDDLRVGIMLGQVENIADRGRAEGIDRLRVVAHDRHPPALRRKLVNDLGLQDIRVLVLIDQHAIELPANDRPGRGVFQQAVPIEQQVVVVQHAAGLLAIDVAAEQPLQFRAPFQAPGKVPHQGVFELLAGVDATAVNVHAGPLLGEPPIGLGQAQLGADDVHQVLGIGPIVDRETGRQPDGLAVAAEQARGDGVKGPAPEPADVKSPQPEIRCRPSPDCPPPAASGEACSPRGAAFRPPPAG